MLKIKLKDIAFEIFWISIWSIMVSLGIYLIETLVQRPLGAP